MNKIIKRHSDGSVTTLGEVFVTVSKGVITGAGVVTITVLAAVGAVTLLETSKKNDT